ncbi:MAG: PhnD/SsuA/transferrin family substrate-binding protein [Hydrogenophilales bacterium]|nr:PhnD/SsuA/transferrin family substrate-binding protein [Hydrogenophilales bacterium]
MRACPRGLSRVLALCLLLIPGLATVRAEPLPPVSIGFYTPVIRDIPRKDVEVSLRFWIEELARSLNLTYTPVRFYDHIEALKRDIDAGKINFLVANSMGVVQHFSLGELGDGFSGYKNIPDHLILIVRRDAGIHGLADLAGKRIGLLDGDELSNIYLETLLMKTWGKPDWNRLGPVSREQRSSKLAHRLFFGQADAALIYRSGYEAVLALNPQVAQRLHVLEEHTFRIRSPHIGLFSARVRPEHREAITQAALKLNDSARGRQVMQIYLADSMVRTKVDELEPFRELLTTYRALRARADAQTEKKGGGK